MKNSTKVIIIGAGASGLCAAYELKELGISCTLLEQGSQAGWSWVNMPKSISLLSPWKRNHINGTKPNIRNLHKMHSCEEYGEYLKSYAASNSLNVITESKVESISKNSEGQFIINTPHSEFKCDVLINATGYFFNPIKPEFSKNADDIDDLHVQQFVSASWLKKKYPNARKVLIIGGRISAGQTATELQQSGQFDVSISSRTPIQFAQPPYAQKIAFWFYYIWEDILAKIKPHALENTNPPMEAGETKKLIEQGQIKIYPNVKKIIKKSIQFVDDQQTDFDLIIYATGFAPEVQHLKSVDSNNLLKQGSSFESNKYKNLFFLGLDNQVNFRSRYLRGIREDAKKLARLVSERIVRGE